MKVFTIQWTCVWGPSSNKGRPALTSPFGPKRVTGGHTRTETGLNSLILKTFNIWILHKPRLPGCNTLISDKLKRTYRLSWPLPAFLRFKAEIVGPNTAIKSQQTARVVESQRPNFIVNLATKNAKLKELCNPKVPVSNTDKCTTLVL